MCKVQRTAICTFAHIVCVKWRKWKPIALCSAFLALCSAGGCSSQRNVQSWLQSGEAVHNVQGRLAHRVQLIAVCCVKAKLGKCGKVLNWWRYAVPMVCSAHCAELPLQSAASCSGCEAVQSLQVWSWLQSVVGAHRTVTPPLGHHIVCKHWWSSSFGWWCKSLMTLLRCSTGWKPPFHQYQHHFRGQREWNKDNLKAENIE